MRQRGRTRLTFQKPIPGNDGFGLNTAAGGWGDDIDIGVSLTPARGVESEVNGAVTSVQVYSCEIRSHYVLSGPRINTKWRAVDAQTGRTFNVSAVAQKDDDYRWMKVTLSDGDPT